MDALTETTPQTEWHVCAALWKIGFFTHGDSMKTTPVIKVRSPLRKILEGILIYVSLVPFIGLHLATVLVFFVPFSWTCLGLFLGLFLVRTFGLTGGFHRYFAHRSYKTSRVFQFCMGILGSAALQKGPMWWAGEHRDHHKYSDKDGDPHSPIKNSVWFSHVGWVIDRRHLETNWDNMKDWQAYPELKWLDRLHFIPGLLVAGLCYWIAGWPGVVWGFVLSTVCLYHSTFCVNSVCHLFGYRRFNTDEFSRNNWFVALITLGEGWHNNHHHYQSSARQGMTWYEVDVTYAILQLLGFFRIVWDIREPTAVALNTDNATGFAPLAVLTGDERKRLKPEQ